MIVGAKGCIPGVGGAMNGSAILICCLVGSTCLGQGPRSDVLKEAVDPVKTQKQGSDGKDDLAKGLEIRFDEKSQRFILKNAGNRPVWFYAYGPEFPLSTVQRLTPDGWVKTSAHWCGTGAKNFRLDPGSQVAFIRQLKTDRGYLAPYGDLQAKYPGLESLPMRVGLYVYRAEDDFKSEVMVWSEKWDGPMPVSPRK